MTLAARHPSSLYPIACAVPQPASALIVASSQESHYDERFGPGDRSGSRDRCAGVQNLDENPDEIGFPPVSTIHPASW